MNILLVGNYLPDQQESMQRFTEVLNRGLIGSGHHVKVVRPPVFVGRLLPSPNGLGKWLGYIDRFCLFPYLLRKWATWADIVHICVNPIYSKWLVSKPTVATCHDLLAIRSALGEIPQQRTPWTGRRFQQMILDGFHRATHIACISQATKRELRRIGGPSLPNASVVYNGLNYPYSAMPEAEASARLGRLGVQGPFLLHVGGNQWYKNRLGVLQIFYSLRTRSGAEHLKLVMAGKPWTQEMRAFVRENNIGQQVLELRSVANEDLRALYSKATALLFPSLEEGFGWPIIEAQACGCPVITSDRAPMNEIGGEAGIYVNPEDPDSAAEVIVKNLPNLTQLRAAGIRNAARFSTSSMIDGYLSLYRSLLNENSACNSLR